MQKSDFKDKSTRKDKWDMSTQFTSALTDEWLVTRYHGGRQGMYNVDFGADSNRVLELYERLVEFDEPVVDPGSNVQSGREFWYEIVCGADEWTFGRFGGTFAVGSGDIARFEGIGDAGDLGGGDREDT